MEEEQRWQEGHRLCANNCGFFGSPATHDLCSKCYRDLRLKEEQASSAKIAVEKTLSSSFSSSSSAAAAAVAAASISSPVHPSAAEEAASLSVAAPVPGQAAVSAAEQEQKKGPSRCAACRKRVGLTGFRCRCGGMYCGAHRYAEQHACGFDYKATGRQAIARANVVVKADKLRRI